METIIQDGLPVWRIHSFQPTPRKRHAADCTIAMPKVAPGHLVIDRQVSAGSLEAPCERLKPKAYGEQAAQQAQQAFRRVYRGAYSVTSGEIPDCWRKLRTRRFCFVPSESSFAEIHREF